MKRYFTVAGTRYELVPVEEWSFAEAQTFQRVSGMAVGVVAGGLVNYDANAYLGWFTVCVQRANPSMTERDLVALNFIETVEGIEEVGEPADPEPNPPIASPSDSGGSDAETSASQRTREASGTPVG